MKSLTTGNWLQRFAKIFVAAGAIGLLAVYVLAFVVSGFEVRALSVVGWDRGLKAVLIFAVVAALIGSFSLKKRVEE